MNLDSFMAATRFGLGFAPGEDKAIGRDPRGWLMAQLGTPQIPPEVSGFTGGNKATQALIAHFRSKKTDKIEGTLRAIREAYIEESGARFQAQQNSAQPFIERLTMFWSNHFTVSVQKAGVAGIANQFEVQAIRPHVTGKFADMLIAVCRHPAMLMYLDNTQSFGPNSRLGKRRGKGLNENLAREILELHTLGVDGGYSQQDVIELAKIITGWSLAREGTVILPEFAFQALVHEPGAKTLLGRTYAEDGENEGIAALRDLARHPATAHFIATKLARHFIADEPPRQAVGKIASAFRNSDGDLYQVSKTLVEMPECWEQPLAKFKTPYEFALSALRLTGIKATAEQVAMGLEGLNYRVFNANSPAGYADIAAAWSSPDAVMKRIEWARALSKRLPAGIDPAKIAAQAFGPVLREETRFIVAGAETGQDGLAFLLASPEFQRR